MHTYTHSRHCATSKNTNTAKVRTNVHVTVTTLNQSNNNNTESTPQSRSSLRQPVYIHRCAPALTANSRMLMPWGQVMCVCVFVVFWTYTCINGVGSGTVCVEILRMPMLRGQVMCVCMYVCMCIYIYIYIWNFAHANAVGSGNVCVCFCGIFEHVPV